MVDEPPTFHVYEYIVQWFVQIHVLRFQHSTRTQSLSFHILRLRSGNSLNVWFVVIPLNVLTIVGDAKGLHYKNMYVVRHYPHL